MREAAREAADGLYEAAPGQRLPAAMKGLGDRIERVDARGREDRAAILEALATPKDRPGA